MPGMSRHKNKEQRATFSANALESNSTVFANKIQLLLNDVDTGLSSLFNLIISRMRSWQRQWPQQGGLA
jgi:hypothetical protein